MKRARPLLRGAVAGAAVGAAMWALPWVAWGWTAVQDVRGFLMELVLGRLAGHLPSAILAWWAGPIGIAGIWLVGGACAGAAVTAVVGWRWRDADVIPRTAALVLGGVVTAWAIIWCRVALLYHTSTLWTWQGISILGLCLGIGGVTAWVCGRAMQWCLSAKWPALAGAVVLLSMAGWQLVDDHAAAQPTAPLPAGSASQVLMLGLDGADWDVMWALLREGKLPHFRELIAQGSVAQLRTTLPWKTPIVWTSMATGKRAYAHGVRDFVTREPTTGRPVPMSVGERRLPAIWDMTNRAGLPVTLVNWYGSWPAEPIQGSWVSDRLHFDGLDRRVHPEELWPTVKPLMMSESRTVTTHEAVMAQIGLKLLERDRSPLWALYLRETDHEAHLGWHAFAGRRGSWLTRTLHHLTPAQAAQQPDTLAEAYQRADEVLGAMRRLAPDATILVVSDHGAGLKAPGLRHFNLNPLLDLLGVGARLSDASDHAWLAKRRLIPTRGDGALIMTRVELEDIAQQLRILKTSDGQRVFTAVRVKDEPPLSGAIEAQVAWHLKESDVALNGGTVTVSSLTWQTQRSGTHRMHGILILAGHGIRSGYRIREASVLDVAPTLCALLGIPVARDFEGRILEEAFTTAQRATRRPPRIATYGARSASYRPEPTVADQELLDRLKTLGYLQ